MTLQRAIEIMADRYNYLKHVQKSNRYIEAEIGAIRRVMLYVNVCIEFLGPVEDVNNVNLRQWKEEADKYYASLKKHERPAKLWSEGGGI